MTTMRKMTRLKTKRTRRARLKTKRTKRKKSTKMMKMMTQDGSVADRSNPTHSKVRNPSTCTRGNNKDIDGWITHSNNRIRHLIGELPAHCAIDGDDITTY